MFRLLLTLALVAVATANAAQNTIRFAFDQRLNGAPFAIGTVTTHPDGGAQGLFKYTLLRYYITGIEFTHDGGKTTKLPGACILVDAAKGSTYDIGAHDITAVESVTFSIGVDPARNHLDPTTFDPMHPLYPQMPSMHWGWSAGYRFITAEGAAGVSPASVKTVFQLHGLGDQNYFSVTMPLSAVATNGVITLPITAEYANLVKNIELLQGVIEHSEEGAARESLLNAAAYVFSPAVPSSVEEDGTPVMTIAPNPASGTITISAPVNAQVSLVDQAGRSLRSLTMSADRMFVDVTGLATGTYSVIVRTPNGIVSHERLVLLP